MRIFYESIKYLSAFLFLLILTQTMSGQSTVVINTGTPGTPSHHPGPAYRSSSSSGYDASRYCYLYTSSELAAAGISAGALITDLGWIKDNSDSAKGPANFTILMKNSGGAAFSLADETWINLTNGATQVYNSSSFVMPSTQAPNYIVFPLSTPFLYTGGALEICTEWDISGVSGSPTTGAFSWLWSTVPDRIYGISGTSLSGIDVLSSTYNSISSIDDRRPFIQITYTPPSPCTSPPTAGTAVSDAPSAVCPGESVSLSLTGSSFGSGQIYQWESSPNMAGPYTAVGSSSPSSVVTVNPTTTEYYRAAVTCSGNTQTSTPVQVIVNSGLSGTFTIDASQPTGGSNYASFADAIAALNCGVSGPVEFNVVPSSGPYLEQVVIPEVTGVSTINTITFNGNGNELQYGATSSTDRDVVRLDGADHIIIDSLYINASTGTYGWGVHLINDADNNIIRNCLIESSTTSSSSTNFAGIIIIDDNNSLTTTGDPGCDNNVFTENTIIGGYTGIGIVADGDGLTALVENNQVTNNTFLDFYNYGVYLNGGNNTLIEGNDLSRPNRTNVGDFEAIYLTRGCLNTLVSKNSLHNPFDAEPGATNGVYAIYLYLCEGLPGQENIIVNNEIYNILYGEGNQNGILNNGSEFFKIYHNTFVFDDSASTCTSCGTRGMYIDGTVSQGLEFYNNIVSITRGGSHERQGIYVEDPASVYDGDRNVIYIDTMLPGLNEVGYFNGAGHARLPGWIAASNEDSNSVFSDPGFIDPRNGDLTPQSVLIDGIALSGLAAADILNVPRNPVNPDPGAYEFTGLPCDDINNPIVSNVGITSADVSWNMASGALAFEYEISTNPVPGSGVRTTTSTSITENGLAPSSQYYAHVRSDCGFGGFSTWKTTAFVTNYCEAPEITINRVNDNVVTLNWNAVNGANEYEYEVNTDDVDPVSGTRTSSTTANITGLSEGTLYYAYVRSLCGSGFSPWSVVTFKTNIVGIDESGSGSEVISAYPNPVREQLTVKLDDNIDVRNAQLTLYSITGEALKHLNVTGRQLLVDMTGLSKGIYLLEYKSDSHNKTIRISRQ